MQQASNELQWLSSEFSCTSLQSLRIINIIGATSKTACCESSSGEHHAGNDFADAQSTDEFGFTIGASQTILECIADITETRSSRELKENPDRRDAELERFLSQLNAERKKNMFCDGDEPSERKIDVSSQHNAFVEALYIYMYRTLLDATPKQIRPYVSRTLDSVIEFYNVSEGNFSIWPAFIAAIEAYTSEDLARAQRWLNQICRFGMGSRKAVKQVVEEVWRRRSALCERSGIEMGMVTIDWTQVITDLNCDVLIV